MHQRRNRASLSSAPTGFSSVVYAGKEIPIFSYDQLSHLSQNGLLAKIRLIEDLTGLKAQPKSRQTVSLMNEVIRLQSELLPQEHLESGKAFGSAANLHLHADDDPELDELAAKHHAKHWETDRQMAFDAVRSADRKGVTHEINRTGDRKVPHHHPRSPSPTPGATAGACSQSAGLHRDRYADPEELRGIRINAHTEEVTRRDHMHMGATGVARETRTVRPERAHIPEEHEESHRPERRHVPQAKADHFGPEGLGIVRESATSPDERNIFGDGARSGLQFVKGAVAGKSHLGGDLIGTEPEGLYPHKRRLDQIAVPVHNDNISADWKIPDDEPHLMRQFKQFPDQLQPTEDGYCGVNKPYGGGVRTEGVRIIKEEGSGRLPNCAYDHVEDLWHHPERMGVADAARRKMCLHNISHVPVQIQEKTGEKKVLSLISSPRGASGPRGRRHFNQAYM
ncbi:unnamed protein product [Amoebophrya sp. A25]|nr:unnamed protein product [Amoebophrya sp. A25]|eukprot:GSA25T00022796001.1